MHCLGFCVGLKPPIDKNTPRYDGAELLSVFSKKVDYQ